MLLPTYLHLVGFSLVIAIACGSP
uniref:Uncharacterized protein n=1 Tax=Arundo donax TaxID=35708 RepID=A0A0A9B4T0_ARUDO